MGSDLQALEQRWNGFLSKLSQRVDAVLQEADAGLDQIIEFDVLDQSPISAAITAFESRMLGLQSKISEAWEKLDSQLDHFDGEAVYQKRDALFEQGEHLRRQIELQTTQLRVTKQASAARRLQALAEQELASLEHRCANCGGPIEPSIRHAACNVTCPSCGAVNGVRPGPAASCFFAGGAIHFLAEEASLPLWIALQQQENHFNDLRDRSGADLARLEQATEAYWRAYCTRRGQLDPSWTDEQVEAEIRGKMGAFRSFHRS